jgi:hypothetical protein
VPFSPEALNLIAVPLNWKSDIAELQIVYVFQPSFTISPYLTRSLVLAFSLYLPME